MSTEEQPVAAPPRRLKWMAPVVIVVLALAAHLIGRQYVDDDNSLQSLVAVLSWFAAFIAISIWWLFFSGVRWSTRLGGVAAFVVLVTILLVLFRFEGQAGNFIPQFSFRFSPTAEDRALEYFSDKSAESAIEVGEAIRATENDWPRFGGPRGDQIVRGEKIRTDWDANPPEELWRHPIGPGWSSISVVGDYLFTQEQRGEQECVVCYAASTGEQVWVHEDNVRFEEPAGGPGPHATPTVHEDRVYSLGATGVLNCLDVRTGEAIWTTDIVAEAGGRLLEWAASGSPVICRDLVIVNPGTSTAFLSAYDMATGERVWQAQEARSSYATPVIATIEGEEQIVAVRAQGVGGYSLVDGSELWFFSWSNATQINCSQPIILPDESVFISIGYGGGSARLDVTRDGDQWSVNSRWERPNRFKLKFNGGIHLDGYVYGLDEGVLSCFDLEQGKRTWKQGRYQFGQILWVDQSLIVLTESGEIVLLDAKPESVSEVARFAAINGKTWNHPVVNRGRLFVRNAAEIACFDLSTASGD